MPDPSSSQGDTASRHAALTRTFVVRVLFILGLIALAYAAMKLSTVFLMATGAVVVAVIIHLIADPLKRRLNVPKKYAVLSAILILALILAGFGWLFGSQLAAQVDTFLSELPRSVEQVRSSVEQNPFGEVAVQAWNGASEQAGAALGYLRGLVSNVVNSVVGLVVIVVAGVMLASRPTTYRDGLLLLLPSTSRDRMRAVMNASGRSLKGWMIGQLIAMAVIAILVSIGLAIVGVPSWLILGLLAGLAQFVPLIGPIVSAVPGLLIAASMGWVPFAWTLAIYVGVQQLESNFLTPYVMNRTTSLPMVLTLFSILAFTTLFGPLGAVFATPITVVLYVMVQMLYVEDTLDETLDVKGERSHEAPAGD
ncbi:AI-2E family transporter [Aquisalinus flavus]|uniref:AI-2E family transporter n=1 Tax=Aquisalinus flavus TaxID=1526572 RepID=A0A8J2V6U5_9PROT|nr:AI-2E family transporter [Aquisalinus flavus]MBD0426895.1 AI-2E family transporter [Aquisalinus flavus]UNE46739.1 AI-2E family transporter [Aquisalinus flavus]GGC96803.1 AI-2E family transporter [Aquisalinus flavus]